ncbi:ABC transporter ATP-binding protein [Paraburkholderia diazotrophica]
MNEILKVEGLSKHYAVGSRWFGHGRRVHAVDAVSFEIFRGEIVGLVGESGSGKTTLGRTLLRLVEPTSGKITFEGKDITDAPGRAMRAIRQRMQIIFQDPYASLNPRQCVGSQICEAYAIHNLFDKRERAERAVKLLERVGLNRSQFDRFPHEFSGGQRQRIGIARALALEPSFIVADEAVSALDVSVQAQVVNLLLDLQRDLGLTILFITHDLSLVEYICDRVIVMYMGKIVESGAVAQVYGRPAHPYTRALLASVPIPDPTRKTVGEALLKGELPTPMSLSPGCAFRRRCPYATEECTRDVPPLRAVREGHSAACFFAERIMDSDQAALRGSRGIEHGLVDKIAVSH